MRRRAAVRRRSAWRASCSGANFLDYGALPVPDARSLGMLGIEIGVGVTVAAAMVSIFHDLITFE